MTIGPVQRQFLARLPLRINLMLILERLMRLFDYQGKLTQGMASCSSHVTEVFLERFHHVFLNKLWSDHMAIVNVRVILQPHNFNVF